MLTGEQFSQLYRYILKLFNNARFSPSGEHESIRQRCGAKVYLYYLELFMDQNQDIHGLIQADLPTGVFAELGLTKAKETTDDESTIASHGHFPNKKQKQNSAGRNQLMMMVGGNMEKGHKLRKESSDAMLEVSKKRLAQGDSMLALMKVSQDTEAESKLDESISKYLQMLEELESKMITAVQAGNEQTI